MIRAFFLATLLPVGAAEYAVDLPRISSGGGESAGGQYRVNGKPSELATTASGGQYRVVGAIPTIGIPMQNADVPYLTLTQRDRNFILSWRVTTALFLLETTPDLRPPVTWTIISNTRSIVNNTNLVSVLSAPGLSFFRLRQP